MLILKKEVNPSISILTFGIARDITGESILQWECDLPISVQDLKAQLLQRFPRFKMLGSLQIAVNAAYTSDLCLIQQGDEIALIPPVSGG